MNYAYYKKLQRKEMIKNGIFITIILVFACISIFYIYNKFKDTRDAMISSESLQVTFHEKEKDKVTMTKVTPVTDAVGLSGKSYTFTIQNNSNKKVKYEVKIIEDEKEIKKDGCLEDRIPLNIIKAGIHREGEVSEIYNLDDLENGVLTKQTLAPQEQVKYTVRFWISNSTLTTGPNMHFHGLLKIEEK